jgi:sulfur carrier protein ThiS
MANNIAVQVVGGATQTLNGLCTVADVKKALGKDKFAAKVNGSPAADEDALSDYAFVTLSEAVKGA